MREANKTSAYIDGYNAFCDRLEKREEQTSWSQYATEYEQDEWFAGYKDAKEDHRPQ